MSYESDLREATRARQARLGLIARPAVVPAERVGRKTRAQTAQQVAQVFDLPLERLVRHSAQAVDALKGASAFDLRINAIYAAVAKFYAVSMDRMIAHSRWPELDQPRAVAMFLARKITGRSYTQIGDRLGGRYHSTVLSAVRRIDELRAQNERLNDELQLITMALLERYQPLNFGEAA